MWGGKDGVIKQHLRNLPRSFHTTRQPVVCVARRYISIERANTARLAQRGVGAGAVPRPGDRTRAR